MATVEEPIRALPFVLEKLPNLLCYNLLVPLLSLNATEAEALQLAEDLGASSSTAYTPPPGGGSYTTTKRPRPWLPSITARPKEPSGCTLTIWRSEQGSVLFPWFSVVIEEDMIDIQRSSLILRGDHLAARLAVSSAGFSRLAQEAREAHIPCKEELLKDTYANGLSCRACKAILSAAPVHSVLRAPKLPWGELLECLTCVSQDEYLQSSTVDPALVPNPARTVSPRPGCLIVSEAQVRVASESVVSNAIRPRVENDTHALLCHDSNEIDDVSYHDRHAHSHDHNDDHDHVVYSSWRLCECSNCGAWLGDARFDESKEAQLLEARFVKFALGSPSVLLKYRAENAVAGAILEAANTRECYRFVLGESRSEPLAKLVMLGETWVRTGSENRLSDESDLRLVPGVKLMYELVNESARHQALLWALEKGAENVVLPEANSVGAVLIALERGNRFLPHSSRRSADGWRIAYLSW